MNPKFIVFRLGNFFYYRQHFGNYNKFAVPLALPPQVVVRVAPSVNTYTIPWQNLLYIYIYIV